MAGDINFNISKLPESPIFWILVLILIFIGLLASGHPATAFTLLFVCVFVICLIAAINSTDSNTTAVYAMICLFCFLFVFALGWIFVPDEWNTKEEPAPQTTNTTKIIPEQLAIVIQS